MLKRKKVTRTILAFIATLCFSIGPFVSAARAESFSGNQFIYYHYSNNIQGTASGYRETTADYYIYNDPTNLKYRSVVTVNFEGPVIGTFNLGLPVQYNSSDVVVTENCTVDSVTTSSGSTMWYFHVNGVDSCTVEYYTNVTSRGVSSFSGLWEHSTDLSDINTTLGQIKSYVDGVETLLGQIRTATSYKIEPYQHAAWIYSSKYDSSFPRWKYGLPYMNYSTSYNDSTYSASHGIRLSTGYSYAMMFYSSKALSTSDVTLYYNGTGNVSVSTVPINEINSQLYLMGFIFKNERNGFSSFEAEFGQTFEMYPLYFGLTNNIPDEVRSLFGMEYDNTYTRLLRQISQGISALQSDQTVIDNSTTVTNNFNTEVTKINNIETTILTNFDSRLNTVNSAITDSGVLTDTISQLGSRWADFYIGKVFDNLVVIKYPIYIILIGFVLLCLLG